MTRALTDVTLVGIDCLDIDRLRRAADICQREIAFGGVRLLSSRPSTDPRVRAIRALHGLEEYSRFCLEQLHLNVETDFALVIQHDGFILNPDAWTEKFLSYDYIGAPWDQFTVDRVGNGGFSLRSRRMMEWIARHRHALGGRPHPEDIWIGRHARRVLEDRGFRFAPDALAARFSKEGSEHSVVWDGQFGFHGLDITDLSQWFARNPACRSQYSRQDDDYLQLRRRFPERNPTVHTLRFFPPQMAAFEELASGRKSCEARAENEMPAELVRPGDTMLMRRINVPSGPGVPPAFARKVVAIDTFQNRQALLDRHPGTRLTPKGEPSWLEVILERVLGQRARPRKDGYAIIHFEADSP